MVLKINRLNVRFVKAIFMFIDKTKNALNKTQLSYDLITLKIQKKTKDNDSESYII